MLIESSYQHVDPIPTGSKNFCLFMGGWRKVFVHLIIFRIQSLKLSLTLVAIFFFSRVYRMFVTTAPRQLLCLIFCTLRGH